MQISARWASEVPSADCCLLHTPALAAGSSAEHEGLRTKASKTLLRTFLALLSHVNSVHPYFVSSLHCLPVLFLHAEQVGREVWFSAPVHCTLHHVCIPFSFLLFLVSCVLSPVHPPLFYLPVPVSILLLPCSDSHVFVSSSLSFPHLFLPYKENSCPFMCFL